MNITYFLKTKTPKNDLKKALNVIQEFKACEGMEEWALTPFVAWMKLEQLEEFLEYLVNKKPLHEDTIEAIKRK